MDGVHAHSVADCNGVSGDSWGLGMAQTDAFTHMHINTYIANLLFTCTAHTCKHECIAGVVVQIQILTDCNVHVEHIQTHIHRHVDVHLHKHTVCADSQEMFHSRNNVLSIVF